MARRQYAPHSIERTVTLFWLSINIRRRNECWDWTGYTEDGYGRFSFEGKMRGAPELALEFYSGEKRTPGLDTCHSCNRRICCNPHHLRFDTRKSNVADMIEAGTLRLPPHVLTADDAEWIRVRSIAGAGGQDLARDFGVSSAMISMILSGRRWPNAGGPIRTPDRHRKRK